MNLHRIYSCWLMLAIGVAAAACIRIIPGAVVPGGYGYRFVAGGNYIGSAPRISPDGDQLVFGSPRENLGDIYVMNVDGSGRRLLFGTPSYEGGPVWSPDGGSVAFVSEKDGGGDIYLIGRDGTGLVKLTNHSYSESPIFSHNGQMLAYVRRDVRERYMMTVCVMDLATHQVLVETDPIPAASLVGWSQDDTEISFCGLPSTPEAHYGSDGAVRVTGVDESLLPGVVRRSGNTPGRVVRAEAQNCVLFTWDPAGDFNYEVFKVACGTGEMSQLTDMRTYISGASISVDEQAAWVYFVADPHRRGSGTIYRVPLSGGTPERVGDL
jgi:Tol biopolymer transport system component